MVGWGSVFRGLACGLISLAAFVVYLQTFSGATMLFAGSEDEMRAAATGSQGAILDLYALRRLDIQEHAGAIAWPSLETYHTTRKHLLYFRLTQPAYRLADVVLDRVPLANSTVMRMKFGNAVFGALALVFAYLAFSSVLSGRVALLVTAWFGISYSTWVSASVSETYGLTLLAVAVLLALTTRPAVRADWRWSLSLGLAAAVCALCDLRYITTALIPMGRLAFAPGSLRARVFAAIGSGAVSVMALVGAYEAYAIVAGEPQYHIASMVPAMSGYRNEFAAATWQDALRQIPAHLYAHSLGAISPLRRDLFSLGFDAATQMRTALVCVFSIAALVLVVPVLPAVLRRCCWGRWSGVAAWLVAYEVVSLSTAPASFGLACRSAALLLGILFLVVPVVVRRWRESRFFPAMAGVVVVASMAANVVIVRSLARVIEAILKT